MNKQARVWPGDLVDGVRITDVMVEYVKVGQDIVRDWTVLEKRQVAFPDHAPHTLPESQCRYEWSRQGTMVTELLVTLKEVG